MSEADRMEQRVITADEELWEQVRALSVAGHVSRSRLVRDVLRVHLGDWAREHLATIHASIWPDGAEK